MSKYAFPPAQQAVAAIADSEQLFPVRRIFCVGRNYGKHVQEMGGDPKTDPPIFFTKPADAIVPSGSTLPFPKATRDLHHEVELVVALGQALDNASTTDAAYAVFGLAVGVDLTRRDLQAVAKKKGAPWDTAKAFDRSAPLGPILPIDHLPETLHGEISLRVNGEIRQQADLGDMIWSVPELLSELSRLFQLLPGDLVFTGTPEGVAALHPGDQVSCHVENVGNLSFQLQR